MSNQHFKLNWQSEISKTISLTTIDSKLSLKSLLIKSFIIVSIGTELFIFRINRIEKKQLEDNALNVTLIQKLHLYFLSNDDDDNSLLNFSNDQILLFTNQGRLFILQINFKDFSYEIVFTQMLESSSKTLFSFNNKFLILLGKDLFLYEFYSSNKEKTLFSNKILQVYTDESIVQSVIDHNHILISTNRRVLYINLDKDLNFETIFTRDSIDDYGGTIADGRIYYIKSNFEVGIYNIIDKKKFSVKHKAQLSIFDLNFSYFLTSTQNYVVIMSKFCKELYFISLKTQKIFLKEAIIYDKCSFLSTQDYFIIVSLNSFAFRLNFKIGILFDGNKPLNEGLFLETLRNSVTSMKKVHSYKLVRGKEHVI